MSVTKKILSLLFLLIVFIAACVYTKLAPFSYEFNSETVDKIVTEPEDSIEKEESTPIAQEEEFKKVEEFPVSKEEENPLETQKNIEKIIEQNFEEEKKQNINIATKESLQEQINAVLENNGIMFQRMSYEVANESKETIKKIAQIIIKNPNIKIEVAGHTDAKGDDNFNQMISEQRANSVKNLLIQIGVQEKRLRAKGYGKTMPLVENDNEGYSLTNRRVEFNIIEE